MPQTFFKYNGISKDMLPAATDLQNTVSEYVMLG